MLFFRWNQSWHGYRKVQRHYIVGVTPVGCPARRRAPGEHELSLLPAEEKS